jgi:hypothetical protein
MDGANRPPACELRLGGESEIPMDRLTVEDSGSCDSSCQCSKTQPEVTIRSKRYGRGAVESGIESQS